jgi:hypothetical protein
VILPLLVFPGLRLDLLLMKPELDKSKELKLIFSKLLKEILTIEILIGVH